MHYPDIGGKFLSGYREKMHKRKLFELVTIRFEKQISKVHKKWEKKTFDILI